MPMRRPAAAIEPVSPMASNNAALPGPMAIDDPSKMRMRGSKRSFIHPCSFFTREEVGM
jgi:hypothetical protein